MKSVFTINIEKETLKNNYYRHVLWTGEHMQVVVMSLKPKEEIGMEVHQHIDQFFRVEKGKCNAVVRGKLYKLKDGDIITIPAGAQHNIINASADESLQLYTIYTPPQHKPGTKQKNKPKDD